MHLVASSSSFNNLGLYPRVNIYVWAVRHLLQLILIRRWVGCAAVTSVKSAASLSSSLAYFTINNLICYLSAKVNRWIVCNMFKGNFASSPSIWWEGDTPVTTNATYEVTQFYNTQHTFLPVAQCPIMIDSGSVSVLVGFLEASISWHHLKYSDKTI